MKNDNKRSIAFDKNIREGVLIAAETKGAEYIEDAKDETYQPSAKFNAEIKQIIWADHNKPKRSLFSNRYFLAFSRVSAFVVIALILFFAITPNVSAARNWITKLVIEANPIYATYYLEGEEGASQNSQTLQDFVPGGAFYPTYLPDGMKLLTFQYSISGGVYAFTGTGGNEVKLQILGSDTTVNMDNEDLEEQGVQIVEGIEVRYQLKNGFSTLIWNQSDRLIILRTTLSRQEAFQIAAGVISNR